MIFGKLVQTLFGKDTDIIATLNKFQSNITSLLNPIAAVPFIGANLVSGVVLDNTKDNIINTGLGYPYRGYWVVRYYNCAGFTDVFESDTLNNNPDKILILKCLDKLTVDIYIF